MRMLAPSLVALALLVARPLPAGAFYEGGELELRGFVGLGAGYLDYPDDNLIYTEGDDLAGSGSLRLLADYRPAGDYLLTGNLLQAIYEKPPLAPPLALAVPPDVERSSALTWEQQDSSGSRSELLVDTLFLRYRSERFNLTIGRQPVNLAATFYFTPNDLFAPFAPQTFFRTYKPGVDGLRIDYRLAELSQATLLGVLAYEPDPGSANGWSASPDWSGSSLLARVSHEMGGFEWALLAGTADDHTISGGSVQGDLFGLVVLRMEGHYADPETDSGQSRYRISTGIEKLYASSFQWRIEYYHDSAPPVTPMVTGSSYAALGGGYQFTPLLYGGLVALANLNDGSELFSGNLLYSVSDESELSLTISLPSGDRPTLTGPGSEFGRQPTSVLIEYRLYF